MISEPLAGADASLESAAHSGADSTTATANLARNLKIEPLQAIVRGPAVSLSALFEIPPPAPGLRRSAENPRITAGKNNSTNEKMLESIA